MIKTPPFLSTSRGAMLALVLGISIFSIQDPIIKSLSDTYPLTEAIAFRGLFALPIHAAGLAPPRHPRPTRTQPPSAPVGPCGPTIAGFAWNTAVSGAQPVSLQPTIVMGRSDRVTVPTAFVQVT
jgi:drug/metabolite transporter (DMT)-like permease